MISPCTAGSGTSEIRQKSFSQLPFPTDQDNRIDHGVEEWQTELHESQHNPPSRVGPSHDSSMYPSAGTKHRHLCGILQGQI